MVRLVDDQKIVVGSVVLGYEGDRLRAEMTAASLRTWLERQLMGAYSRYSAELRDRLRWRTGVGAAETMDQVCRLAVDMEEVRFDNLELRSKIEGLESELASLRGMYRYKFQEHGSAIRELLAASKTIEGYRRVLRAIADASHDTASRLAAEGVLYAEGP